MIHHATIISTKWEYNPTILSKKKSGLTLCNLQKITTQSYGSLSLFFS